MTRSGGALAAPEVVTGEQDVAIILVRVSTRRQAIKTSSHVRQFASAVRVLHVAGIKRFSISAEVATVSATPARAAREDRAVLLRLLTDLEESAIGAQTTAVLLVASLTRLTRSQAQVRDIQASFPHVSLVFLDSGDDTAHREEVGRKTASCCGSVPRHQHGCC